MRLTATCVTIILLRLLLNAWLSWWLLLCLSGRSLGSLGVWGRCGCNLLLNHLLLHLLGCRSRCRSWLLLALLVSAQFVRILAFLLFYVFFYALLNILFEFAALKH